MFGEVHSVSLPSKVCPIHKQAPQKLSMIEANHGMPLKTHVQDFQILVVDMAGKRHASKTT